MAETCVGEEKVQNTEAESAGRDLAWRLSTEKNAQPKR